MMKITRRFRSYAKRLQKERSGAWIPRLETAQAKNWAKLHVQMEMGIFSEKHLRRFERHGSRLLSLAIPFIRWDHILLRFFYYGPQTLYKRPRPPSVYRPIL